MRSEKIAIAISRDERGKLVVQVLGINGDRVVSSVSELEQAGIGFASATRAVERLWTTIKLRLNRGQLELIPKEGATNNHDDRTGYDYDLD